jgi:hypothetical protein
VWSETLRQFWEALLYTRKELSIPGTLLGGLFILFIPNIAEEVSTGLAQAGL